MEASIHQLQVNPAQMRTRTSLEQLAGLAVQVQGGLDKSLPLVVVPNDEFYRVVSGHRRWLARMVGYLCSLKHGLPPDAETALAQMIETIQEHCQVTDGFIELSEDLYMTLLDKITDNVTVPIVIGPKQDELLTLIRANMGAEEPDLLGQAHVFLAAVEADVLTRDLAEATGMPERKIEAIMVIPSLPRVFQTMLLDGQLDLEVVPDLINLSVKQRQGLGNALMEYTKDCPRSNMTGSVKLAALQINSGPMILNPKVSRPHEYNTSYVLHQLWKLAEAQAAKKLYKAAASQSLHGFSRGPRSIYAVLLEIPALANYLTQGSYGLSQDALALLPDGYTCDNCAYATLPAELLRFDYEVPCRKSGTQPKARCCICCAPIDKKWVIRTPWNWDVGAGKDVSTPAAVLKAWQAQHQFESRRGKSRAETPDGISAEMHQQRKTIQNFMDRHRLPPFYTEHPWATSCDWCTFHREDSPVKSAPDAPPCEWAKGRHNVYFEALIPSHKGTLCLELRKIIPEDQGRVPLSEWPDFNPAKIEFMVPWCRQFEPVHPWSELIPEAEEKSPFPREVVIRIIEHLAAATNRNAYGTYSRGAVQFLTGKPTGSHQAHFDKVFKKQQKDLSLPQLWTLAQWLMLQFSRVSSMTTRQVVPLGAGLTMACTIVDFPNACTLWDETQLEEEEG